MASKVIFSQDTEFVLDRDGTIIKEKTFIKNPQEIEFIPGSIQAINILKKEFIPPNFVLKILSNNQSPNS